MKRFLIKVANRRFEEIPANRSNVMKSQQTRVYPYPLGAGSARPNPKMGAPDPENPFISRVFLCSEGIETMVSDHGLGRGRTMGWG